MPSQNVKIAIGVSTAVVVVAVVVIVVLFAFPIKQPEQAADDLAVALPSTITYDVTSPFNQYTSTYTHDQIDIDTDIEGSLDGMEDGESVIAMYKRAAASYNYTVITHMSEGYRLYFLNTSLSTVYEPISVSSVEDLAGIATMTSLSSGTTYDVSIALKF
jgi:hypothetical protein